MRPAEIHRDRESSVGGMMHFYGPSLPLLSKSICIPGRDSSPKKRRRRICARGRLAERCRAERLQPAGDADRLHRSEQTSSPAQTRTWLMARLPLYWTRSPRDPGAELSAIPSGSMHSMTRTDELSEIGKQYGTQTRLLSMVGPNWSGELPAGLNAVVRSSSTVALGAPRI